MGVFFVFFSMFCLTALISWMWVNGINNMKKNHPDYEGKDFLDFDDY